MPDASVIEWIHEKYRAVAGVLNERSRRRWAAAEAQSLGWGGVTAVAKATGLTRKTIHAGLREWKAEQADPAAALGADRIRRPGAGRKTITQRQPRLPSALNDLVEPTARGDPGSPLRWTCLSTSRLAATLRSDGFQISPRKVSALLKQSGYSLQANRKTREGTSHPDRNAQFEYIHSTARAFLRRGQPVISVDTKKKELVGDFRNAGREWRPAGKPEKVLVHDFPDPTMKKAIPYGVYDLGRNEGWVSVGIDHDTARFAAATIRRWWRKMGQDRYPKAKELLITADCGGSNSARTRLWKVALQDLADALGLRLTICHFPPGTSKWNKIEHRMFCHITRNWRGRPLTSYAAIVQLIGHTTTDTGLRIRTALDRRRYPTGEPVTPAQLARVRLRPAKFHGEWNYTIVPAAE
ncbi:MAG: ISAzo13 family transposase [Alphaproteobacteria bacterium]|nr:ISAzo13 family transposase [Alphaproteobacteria bacterium]